MSASSLAFWGFHCPMVQLCSWQASCFGCIWSGFYCLPCACHILFHVLSNLHLFCGCFATVCVPFCSSHLGFHLWKEAFLLFIVSLTPLASQAGILLDQVVPFPMWSTTNHVPFFMTSTLPICSLLMFFEHHIPTETGGILIKEGQCCPCSYFTFL